METQATKLQQALKPDVKPRRTRRPKPDAGAALSEIIKLLELLPPDKQKRIMAAVELFLKEPGK